MHDNNPLQFSTEANELDFDHVQKFLNAFYILMEYRTKEEVG